MAETQATVEGLADRVGCCRLAIQLWRDGKVIPNLIYAFRLEEVTKGKVSVAGWLGTDLGRMNWETVCQRSERKKDSARRRRRANG